MTLISHMPIPNMPFETHENVIFESPSKAAREAELRQEERRRDYVQFTNAVDEKKLEKNWREKAEELRRIQSMYESTYYRRKEILQGKLLDISV